MIAEQYVKEAARIRARHNQLMDQMGKMETQLAGYKQRLKDMQATLDSIAESKIPDAQKQTQLNSSVTDIERTYTSIMSQFKPVQDELGKLSKDANLLYAALKERYPDADDKMLQSELGKALRSREGS